MIINTKAKGEGMKFKTFIKNTLQKIKKAMDRMKTIYSKNKLVFVDAKLTTRYEDLAPEDMSNQNSEYFNALDWALNNEKIHNIAIAGPYGSGKSSIINSYIKKHPELKCVNVSLADFLRYDKEGNEVLGDFSDDDLEVGILKQLFYRVSYKKIPQSRYRKLHAIHRRKVLGTVILAEIFCLLLASLFMNNSGERFDNMIRWAMDNSNFSQRGVCIMIGIGMAICTYLVTELLWMILSKVHVREIHIANAATATTTSGTDESIFDKNMDEIVYFFEVTKYNVVFIEDLDRFKSINIFVKLRELNTILNHYEEIKKRIVFLYAIRDDIFSQKDRTKFFEFIIPVIPVINSTNSGEILLERIKKDKENFEDIDEEFVDMVSPYISDMRVLDNICNEFITYRTTLQGLSQDNSGKLNLKDKPMFSLMVLKNLYPEVFAELQAEEGIVKQAFQWKRNFFEQKRAELEKRKSELASMIEQAKIDVLENQREVKLAMLYYMTGCQGSFNYVYMKKNGNYYYFNEILDDEFSLEILKGKSNVYYTNQNGNNNYEFDGTEKFSGKNDFIERCNIIELKAMEKKEQYAKQMEKIEEEIRKLGAMPLKDILEKYEIEEILSEEIQENKLLVFMLRNGLIDEKYSNYMNYFHGSSITKGDMNFILCVRNREGKEFSYPLTRVKQVIKKLRPAEFNQKEIYNFALLDEILMNNDYVEKRDILFRQLSDEDAISWNFINEYFSKARPPHQFIAALAKIWKNMWTYIYKNQFLTEERKDLYLSYICTEAGLEDIVAQNYDNKIKIYFEEKEDIFRRLKNVPIERLISIIERCNIVFCNLDMGGCDDAIVRWIFDNGCYVINVNMLQCIFEKQKPNMKENIWRRNYTEIMELGYQPLINKVNSNILKYTDEILLEVDTNTEEKLEFVLDIIKKVDSLEQARRIIQKENVVLTDLEDCYFEDLYSKEQMRMLWDEWIINKKVLTNWENLVRYGKKFGVTDALLKYIELGIEVLEENLRSDDISWEIIEGVIYSELADNVFERFMKCIPNRKGNVDLKLTSVGHMEVLIRLGFFEFTPAFSRELRSIKQTLYTMALIHNHEIVLNRIESYIIGTEEIIELIQSPELSEIEKIQIIKSKLAYAYPKEIAIYLKDTKEKIGTDMFWLAWKALEETDRSTLFLNQIDILSNDDISQCLAGLGGEYGKFSDRSKRRDEKLRNTVYNEKMVEKLKKMDYITSYKVENKERWDKESNSNKSETFLRCRIKKQ